MSRNLSLLALSCLLFSTPPSARAADPALELKPGQHIAYIGNTTADRMQHHAWLETYLHAQFPGHQLTFRNIGFPGDEVKTRSRSANFGDPNQWLTKLEADVVFCFFGYNEALRGEAGVDQFKKELSEMIDGMRAQKYNGKTPPQIVVFSPIAHENLNSPHLPVGSKNNQNLELYTRTMQTICKEKNVRFVDLFTPTLELYDSVQKPLTMNGIHLLDRGNKALAEVILKELFHRQKPEENQQFLKLHEAVRDKNYHWFSRYRVVDGYNVYGGRSKLAWFGQSNADVMMREMEIFDVKTANRDQLIWARANGKDLDINDDNLPQELEVQTNKPGPLPGGEMPYLGGKEAISQMTIHDGMEVNLFASEERFPRLINPVQMAVDTDSRLWASVWPSYPHWNPTQPRRDALVILPDEDRDGVADDCIVFADELNSVTGFEFWGGGVLVAAPPEIWFLKDTDGDDQADVKIRMLQGVSSADTHHSANAVLVGPDGWLYWSRGIFNVANFETPTKTYRSGSSGVHRFNPRTFEVEFHFPIGPNPHGDVFDQWGFQFASDGTSGTGSYINIGHGVGNKQWYKKRVRPVPAIGILSSSHFPEKYQGNFLISNAIGFLGVLQHNVKYNGADITAEEIDPILVSTDQNFRPSDMEIGGDGALYVADWHNALIGHMQHNMRDPNRDRQHGRIYRVTHKDRPLLQPAKMKGKPIAEVCNQFLAKENGTRYRARLELSGRETEDIVSEVAAWAGQRDISNPADAQALLECLWVFEEHRVPTGQLLKVVVQAAEPRVRAAGIRTLGHWGDEVDSWQKLLSAAGRDESALVRAEAVKAAVAFQNLSAAEIIFDVATRETDPELDAVLKYAKSKINVDAIVNDAINSERKLSPAAESYALLNAPVATLLKMKRTELLYETILNRPSVPAKDLRSSLDALAEMRNRSSAKLLVELISQQQTSNEGGSLDGLGQLLASLPPAELKTVKNSLEQLALNSESSAVKRYGYAAWIAADGSGNSALFAASNSKQSLRELIAAIPLVEDETIRGTLYQDVRSLMFELPPNLQKEEFTGVSQSGIRVEYYYPSPTNVAIETLDQLTPKASGVVPKIVMNVPQKTQNDKFALRFNGFLQIPRSGKYTFYAASDDGSRIYIGNKLVVNNDGLHGMSEKSGSVELSGGLHPITVTYFDNGGGDGLKVSWSGPRIKKQAIPADRLAISGEETIHELAIRSLASIPGHETEKFMDLAGLIKAGQHRPASISVLNTIPEKFWDSKQIPSLVDNLIGYLSTIPAAARTSGTAVEAMTLSRSLSGKLSTEQRQDIANRLQNLDVRIIAIGTVPARMIYDKEQIAVQAGKPVEFRFSNTDHMPHNFSIVLPGALQEIGELAEATANTSDAKQRSYIPKSDKILLGSRLLEPGQSQALTFEAPSQPGIYPYVCTYPGHWRRMYGALYVVEDLDAYLLNPVEYLAANPLPVKDELLTYISRNTEWKYEQLLEVVSPLPHGRSFDVGRNLFKVANCIACHKMNNEGRNLGPDLTKLDEKKHNINHILRSILEPSQQIDEKYQSNVIVLDSGKVVTGMVVEETPQQIKVLIDPLAKADPLVIEKSEIVERNQSKASIMPQGLLNKLTQEEILDLIAYIDTRGNQKDKMYHMHHHGK